MIFTKLDNALSYLRCRGKHIGQDALHGNEAAKQIVRAYSKVREVREPGREAVLLAALNDYLLKWSKSQICRICCQSLEIKWMDDYDGDGYFLYTCPTLPCPMYGATLGSRSYDKMPLKPYLTGKVGWQWDYDTVVEKTWHLYNSWQHQARSIRKLVQGAGKDTLFDHYTTEMAVAIVMLHKTPEDKIPF